MPVKASTFIRCMTEENPTQSITQNLKSSLGGSAKIHQNRTESLRERHFQMHQSVIQNNSQKQNEIGAKNEFETSQGKYFENKELSQKNLDQVQNRFEDSKFKIGSLTTPKQIIFENNSNLRNSQNESLSEKFKKKLEKNVKPQKTLKRSLKNEKMKITNVQNWTKMKSSSDLEKALTPKSNLTKRDRFFQENRNQSKSSDRISQPLNLKRKKYSESNINVNSPKKQMITSKNEKKFLRRASDYNPIGHYQSNRLINFSGLDRVNSHDQNPFLTGEKIQNNKERPLFSLGGSFADGKAVAVNIRVANPTLEINNCGKQATTDRMWSFNLKNSSKKKIERFDQLVQGNKPEGSTISVLDQTGGIDWGEKERYELPDLMNLSFKKEKGHEMAVSISDNQSVIHEKKGSINFSFNQSKTDLENLIHKDSMFSNFHASIPQFPQPCNKLDRPTFFIPNMSSKNDLSSSRFIAENLNKKSRN